MNTIATLSDHELLSIIAAAYDKHQWSTVVELTDAWLESRGTMPPGACHFRSAGLQGLGEYEAALAWGGLACKVTPLSAKPKEAERTMFVSTRIGMGMCFARLGQWDDALRFFRAALRVPTKDPYVAVAQAHLRLAISDSWKKAWREHEQRIGTDRSPVLPNIPEWDGKPTDGPVVVLHEQGIGDAVLFARWLPWIAEQSGHPVIWAGPKFLHRWIAAIPGVGSVVPPEAALLEKVGEGATDVRLVLGSCVTRAMTAPYLHGTTRKSIPAVQAPPLEKPVRRGPMRVGVCWAGAASGHHDFERSIPVEDFALLWEGSLPVEWVSLQYATEPPEGAPFTAMPTGDVYETGERVRSCDLVVTVDTSILHIAGSLGIPTLCLTPTTPDWRYPHWPDGDQTPWYPSVSLIRRDNARATADQVRTARALLELLVQSRYPR